MTYTSTRRFTTLLIYLLGINFVLIGCISKPFIVKPADGYMGNISIRSVAVSKTSAVNSNTIVPAVKSKLQKDAADLNGGKMVDMKVTLDYMTMPLPGGSVTGTLLGSSTELKGIVEIVDGGRVIAKYRIAADYSEGGLLSSTTTISFIDTEKAVVEKFSAFAVNYMK